MKMRKKLAALLAAAMIASVMPMSVFADSTNRVDKVITVAKDAAIKAGDEPTLKVEMKDTLTTGLSFYLELEGAEWAPIATETYEAVYNAGTDSATATLDSVGGLSNQAIGGTAHNTSAETTDNTSARNKFIAQLEADAKKAKKDVKGTLVLDGKRMTFTATGANGTATFEAYRENPKSIAIKLLDNTYGASPVAFTRLNELLFPLLTTVTDSEAVVRVRKHDTEVSNSEHLFAVSDAARAKVVVTESVPNLYRSGAIADITLEELYANAIADVDELERWFTLELRNTDFTFEIDGDAKIVGQRAYREYEKDLIDTDTINGKDVARYELSRDKTRLGIRIPDDSTLNGVKRERGNLVLQGVKIVADRDAKDGKIEAVIESKKLFDKQTITIANRGDYKTKLAVEKVEDVVAGTEKEVKFTLSEDMAKSLIGTRPATFTFDQGVTIKTTGSAGTETWDRITSDDILWGTITNQATKTKIESLLDDLNNETPGTAAYTAAQAALYAYLFNVGIEEEVVRKGKEPWLNAGGHITVKGTDTVDKGKWSVADTDKKVKIARNKKSFTVENFDLDPAKAGSYEFTTTLNIPANVTGDIKVAVAGKGVTEEEIVILRAEAPVTVDATAMDVKVGLKEIETTGKIEIKETAKERLHQGKDIVLRIDGIDSGLKIKSFDWEVKEGNLVIDKDEGIISGNTEKGVWKDGDKALRVKRMSTEPSTIEISNIKMFTDRTVPEGKYDLLVGGNAISDHTNGKDEIDAVKTIKNFVNITTKNTEDISGAGNKAEVSFTVGSTDYLINGKTGTMDAPAYIKDGNTMVSFRYVAQALGVSEEQVTWDGATQTATVLADKVLQVKLGSKTMNVNGVSIPMTASAELVNDRTFVPMGAVARALGVEVVWDNDTKTATFNPAK